ncbi:MAG: hypothetical protein COA78_06540 [Blastopirellula sp.]|nr:MAG: hypothetical protein COA78_06540 [Blastopirellula sp.]
MFASLEVPYYCNEPLGIKTTWVAFPLLISSKNTAYSSALSDGHDVLTELIKISSKLESTSCEIVQISGEEEYKGLITAVEFSKVKNDCFAHIYDSILVKFKSEIPFWEKMEVITLFLDSITEFSETFKTNKLIDIELGNRFNISKK